MEEIVNTALTKQPGVRSAAGGRWPLWGLAAVLLLMSRLLYPTPSLSTQDQTAVTGKLDLFETGFTLNPCGYL